MNSNNLLTTVFRNRQCARRNRGYCPTTYMMFDAMMALLSFPRFCSHKPNSSCSHSNTAQQNGMHDNASENITITSNCNNYADTVTVRTGHETMDWTDSVILRYVNRTINYQIQQTNGNATSRLDGPPKKRLYRQLRRCTVGDAHVVRYH